MRRAKSVAIFAREIIGRDVVDSHQERLGELKDVVFDTSTGSILALRVKIENDIDVSKLPWEMQDGLIQIPVEEINRIAAKIHLKR
ncbi:MAG: PRC-barrel domain containing protein [Candidatus Poseidoniales archaeon]|nr:MAG: PRC-barrel domain containing protein [Candidatus Poseidoniales archaeon]